MIIKNVKVYTEEKMFADGAVVIKDGRFDKVLTTIQFYRYLLVIFIVVFFFHNS